MNNFVIVEHLGKRIIKDFSCEPKKESSEGANKIGSGSKNIITQTEKKNLSDEGNIMSEIEIKKTNEIVSVCSSMPSASESSYPTFAKEELDLMNCVDMSNEHLFALMKGLQANKPDFEIQRAQPHHVDTAIGIARQIGENLKIKLGCIRTAREFR